jgi:hypothetical protein
MPAGQPRPGKGASGCTGPKEVASSMRETRLVAERPA